MKYPYTLEIYKKIYELGKQAAAEYSSINEIPLEVWDSYFFNYWNPNNTTLFAKGFAGEEIDFTVKKYIRIGEPILTPYDDYRRSYNFAAERFEDGISVVTNNWLDSFKAVFFGTSKEKITAKGVWELEGFNIGHGGDDEPLIIALDWAKKTNIKSVTGMKKYLKNL